MNLNDNDQKPSAGSANGGVLKSIFTGVIYIFAFLAAIVVKPAQALKKEAYEKGGLSGFAFGAGILLSIVGSIGAGYFGWQHDVPIQWWLSTAVAAPFAIYYYLWPIAYLAVGKWAFKFSNFLWDHVPDANGSRGAGPKWLSFMLSGLTQLAIVAGAFFLFLTIATHIHDFLGWKNVFAWIGGGVIGAVAAFFAGMLLSGALWNAGMPLVALLSGAALTYFFGVDVSAHVPTFGYDAAVRHTGEGLQVLAWVGYIFPLGHIVVSRMFSWVGKFYGKLLTNTYNDSDKNYIGFLGQAGNLAVTAAAGYYAFGYATTLGLGLWLAAPATAVAVLVAYLIGGVLFGRWSNTFIGVVASIGAFFLGFHYSDGVVPFGASGASLVGAVSAIATGFLAFPIAYQLVRLLAKPLLASWLGQPLVNLYKTISSEVFSAVEKTYEDNTAYASLFVHVVNVAAATAVYFLTSELVSMIHLAGWTAIGLPVLLTASSYLFVGRLLVAYKTPLIGILASIGVGAFVGVEVFAHFDHNLWYAVPAFIGAALAFGFAVFPVSYVVTRAGLELIKASSWAKPVLEGVYNFFFGFISKFWNEFVRVYRRISLSFAPIWASVSKTWDEAWQSAKETFEKAFNGNSKK